jgi:hypothetical protein
MVSLHLRIAKVAQRVYQTANVLYVFKHVFLQFLYRLRVLEHIN